MITVDDRRFTARRLHNLRLSGSQTGSPVDVVHWLGAVQSQDYGPARWSVGARSEPTTDAAVDAIFARGEILRTHLLRPTWHFVAPSDIRWMLALTAPRVHALNAYYYRQSGLDGATLMRAEKVLSDCLRGGQHLTRKEIEVVLRGHGITATGFRLAYILMNAELGALICSGAMKGKQHTYALLDERVPDFPVLSSDEALAELTLRYFRSHGPATAKDFKWWSSLTLAQIAAGLEIVGSRLSRDVVNGVAYWSDPTLTADDIVSPRVDLVQAYDEYIVGYTESKYLLEPVSIDRAIYNHVIILDGRVAGCWKRTMSKNSVLIEVLLYRPFGPGEKRALQAAADAHGEFLGLPATVVETPQ